jgi:hypothetical protein
VALSNDQKAARVYELLHRAIGTAPEAGVIDVSVVSNVVTLVLSEQLVGDAQTDAGYDGVPGLVQTKERTATLTVT